MGSTPLTRIGSRPATAFIGLMTRDAMLKVIRSASWKPHSSGSTSTFAILLGRFTTNAARTRISPSSSTVKSTVWMAAAKWPGPYAITPGSGA